MWRGCCGRACGGCGGVRGEGVVVAVQDGVSNFCTVFHNNYAHLGGTCVQHVFVLCACVSVCVS
jgi:hypothetical protein